MTGKDMIRVVAVMALASLATAAAAAPYRIIDRIAGPDGGWDYVRVDTTNNRLLVARGTSVMAIDLASKAVTPGLAPGVRLHDALPINGGAEVLVTNGGTDTAVFVDAKSGTSLAIVATGKGPDAATFDPVSGLVLVMDHAGGTMTLIDPTTRAVTATISVGGKLEAAVAADGKAFVNVEDRNEIAVIDMAKRAVVARHALPGCDGPTGLAFDAKSHMLIAACDGSTVIVDAVNGKVVKALATGGGADGVAFDPGQRLAFVSAGAAGTLTVVAVDGARSKIVQTLPTQTSARTIAYDSRTDRLYLPAARFGPTPAGGGRAPMQPGSFEVLVIGR